MVTFRKFVLLWMLNETMAACSHTFPAWPQPVLSRISVVHSTVAAGLCDWFEINVNLGEAIKLIFPRSGNADSRDDSRKSKREMKSMSHHVGTVNKDKVSLYHPPPTFFLPYTQHTCTHTCN